MKFFKIGSYILLSTTFIHLLGHFQERIPANETEKQLFELAQNYKFEIMGSTRSLMDFQNGFSLFFALFCLFVAVLNLFIASRVADRVEVMRGVLKINIAGMAIATGICIVYFFAAPLTFMTLPLVFLCYCLFKAWEVKKFYCVCLTTKKFMT